MSDGGAQLIRFGPYWDSANSTIYTGIVVKSFAAGTANAKNVWTDEGKTSAVTSVTDSDNDGRLFFYADGDYKFIVYESDGTTPITGATYDNYKVTSDTGVMWEGNLGTSYHSIVTNNPWQPSILHSATDVFQELYTNDGTNIVVMVKKDADGNWVFNDEYAGASYIDMLDYRTGGSGTFADPYTGNWANVRADVLNASPSATSRALHKDSMAPKIIRWTPGVYEVDLDSPVSLENASGSSEYTDNIIMLGYGAFLKVKAGGTGVTRYEDTTPTAFTVRACIILGAKNFGQVGGAFGLYQEVHGLSFIGDLNEETAGIYCDAGHGFKFSNLYFQDLGYSIKWRVLKNSMANNIQAYDCWSVLYGDNDSADIGGTYWGAGQTSNGWSISDIYATVEQTVFGIAEAKRTRGMLHFYKVGEKKVNNVTILGCARGISETATAVATAGSRWEHFTNIEITSSAQESIFIDGAQDIKMKNVTILTAVNDRSVGWTATVYNVPVFHILGARNCQFDSIHISRASGGLGTPKGGHSIYVGTSAVSSQASWGINFSNINFIENESLYATNTYSLLVLDNAGYCNISNVSQVDVTSPSAPTPDMVYGIYLLNGSSYNNISNVVFRGLTSGLAFDASHYNMVSNVQVREAVAIGTNYGIILVNSDFGNYDGIMVRATTYGISIDANSDKNNFDNLHLYPDTQGNEILQTADNHNTFGKINMTRTTAGAGAIANNVQITAVTGATFSVNVGNTFYATQGVATNVTDFTYAQDQKEICILFGDANSTLVHGASTLFLNGSIDYNPPANTRMKFRCIGTVWYELSRDT